MPQRLKALKKMVSALTSSIVPMMNAFLILFIIASICESRAAYSAPGLRGLTSALRAADAIIGVSLFGLQSPLEFGRFEQAFVTMFHLTTDGQWPSSISQYDEDGGINWMCASFMMSYIVIVNWVVLQARHALPPPGLASHANVAPQNAKPRGDTRKRKITGWTPGLLRFLVHSRTQTVWRNSRAKYRGLGHRLGVGGRTGIDRDE